MNKWIATLLLVLFLIGWLGLYQPFQTIKVQGQVTRKLPFSTIVLSAQGRDHYYPFMPVYDELYILDTVQIRCNQGEWIPVWFDCVFALWHHRPQPFIDL